MDTTPSRLGSFLEWIIAAVVMAALVGGALFVVRQAQRVRVTPVNAEEAAVPAPPAGVPPRTVSVPMLLLADGKELRLGATMAAVTALVGREAQVGDDVVEPAVGRERLTRFYNYLGARFVLVFDAAQDANARVTAIYLE